MPLTFQVPSRNDTNNSSNIVPETQMPNIQKIHRICEETVDAMCNGNDVHHIYKLLCVHICWLLYDKDSKESNTCTYRPLLETSDTQKHSVKLCRKLSMRLCILCSTPTELKELSHKLANGIHAQEQKKLYDLAPTAQSSTPEIVSGVRSLLHYMKVIVPSNHRLCVDALQPLNTLWKITFRDISSPWDIKFKQIQYDVGRNITIEHRQAICGLYLEQIRIGLKKTLERQLQPSNDQDTSQRDLQELHVLLREWNATVPAEYNVSSQLMSMCTCVHTMFPSDLCILHCTTLHSLLLFIRQMVHAEIRYQQLISPKNTLNSDNNGSENSSSAQLSVDACEKRKLVPIIEDVLKHFHVQLPSNIRSGHETSIYHQKDPHAIISSMKSRGVWWIDLYQAYMDRDLNTVRKFHDQLFLQWGEDEAVDSLLECTRVFQLRNRLRHFFDYSVLVMLDLPTNPSSVCEFYTFIHSIFNWPVESTPRRNRVQPRTGNDVAPRLFGAYALRLRQRLWKNGFLFLLNWLDDLVMHTSLGDVRWMVWKSVVRTLHDDKDLVVEHHVDRNLRPAITTGQVNIVHEDEFMHHITDVVGETPCPSLRVMRDLVVQWNNTCSGHSDNDACTTNLCIGGIYAIHKTRWTELPWQPDVQLHPTFSRVVDPILAYYAKSNPQKKLKTNWWYTHATLTLHWNGSTLVEARVIPSSVRVFGVYTYVLENGNNCIICTEPLNAECTNEQCAVQTSKMMSDQCKTCTEPICTGTCGHIFHSCCMDQWLIRASTCPMCRETWKTWSEQVDEATFRIQQTGPEPENIDNNNTQSPRTTKVTSVHGNLILLNMILWIADSHENTCTVNTLMPKIFSSDVFIRSSVCSRIVTHWLSILHQYRIVRPQSYIERAGKTDWEVSLRSPSNSTTNCEVDLHAETKPCVRFVRQQIKQSEDTQLLTSIMESCGIDFDMDSDSSSDSDSN